MTPHFSRKEISLTYVCTQALLFGAIFWLSSCMTFRSSDRKVEKYFEKRDQEIHIQRLPIDGIAVRVLDTGIPASGKGDLLIGVHGAPGSSSNYHSYLSDSALRSDFRLIAFDRPGYGFSQYGNSEISIARQAAILKSVIEQYKPEQGKVLLTGYSYGGPIVAKAAMDYPDIIDGVLMVAPVIDPDNEKIFWFSHFARWPLTKWMLSGALQVAGDEKFSHAEELAKMAGGWAELTMPIFHLHGEKDKIAPFVNLKFSQKHVPAAYFEAKVLPKATHMVHFKEKEYIRSLIHELYTRVQAEP